MKLLALRLNAADTVDQDSVSCSDSEIQSRDENIISDGEAEIVGLMNKVEFMKKERSVLWLREFKEWMDQAPEDMLDEHRITGWSSLGKENYIPNKSCHKHVGESSRYVYESVQTSGDGRSTDILESHHALADTSSGINSYHYLNSVSGRTSESSILGITRDAPLMLRVEGPNLKEGLFQSYSPEDLYRPERIQPS